MGDERACHLCGASGEVQGKGDDLMFICPMGHESHVNQSDDDDDYFEDEDED